MEEMSYKDRIKKFLEDERYYSLLIKGKWGVGKTYLWKEICPDTQSCWDFVETKFFNKKKVIYISLFGKESHREILEEIIIKACGKKIFLELFKDLKLQDINIGAILTLINKYFKYYSFKNTIVCFDDIERKSHKFRMKDFLGLVYQLKEDKCKVVVISDIGKIPNYEEKVFKDYAEKSIDLENEIESKKEVIEQILGEKLKDEYYKKIFPENVYRIENLRNLNKIIEAFKFFSKELNFENELKEKESVKDLFAYVFELIVIKINDDEKSRDGLNGTNTEKIRTVEEIILKKSQNSINNMITDYIKNSTFHISSPIIKEFEEEIENHYFYTLIKMLKEKFYTILMNNGYPIEIKDEIENIINKIEIEKYTDKFTSEILYDNYFSFRIFDFLAIIDVLKLDNDTIKSIKQKLIERLRHESNKWVVKIIYGDNECLKKYAEKVSAKSNTKPNPRRPLQKNEVYKQKLFRIYNYYSFIDFIKQNNKYFEHEGFREVIKDNKIILQYIHYLSSDEKFKNEYPELHEMLCSFLKGEQDK